MTREEAIHFAECLKHNWTIDFNDMEDFCDMAIEALSDGWRTASEKPEKSCDCLLSINVREYDYDGVCTQHRVVRYGHYNIVRDEFEYRNRYPCNESKNKKIMAWMPLPEPYKGGDDE